ncbi:MAG: MBL fold metallo-hydrolase [Ruminococcus sp.]|nr:MBL fold metallo-hydrolase [Ruminococcus sp.]
MSKRRYKKRRKKLTRRCLRGIVLLTVLAAVGAVSLLVWLGVIDPAVFGITKPPAADGASTSVRSIDVGQGDCTLVCSGGSAMLIDSGESDGKDRVISYIKSLGISRLDCVLITHPHSDHMGEMPDILEAFDVGRVIMPRLPDELVPTGYSYEKLLKVINSRDIKLEAASNTGFTLGDIRVDTFIPREYTEKLNNCSTVVKLTHGENSFLITGDCEREEEKDLLTQGFDLSADVLKVGHHGSASASSEEFLAAVRPSYAVISCSADNDYGHPHEKTLMRLKALSVKLYITRDSGTVTFLSDGKGLTVETERGT